MRRKIRWLLLQLRRLMSSPSRKARRLAARKEKEQMYKPTIAELTGSVPVSPPMPNPNRRIAEATSAEELAEASKLAEQKFNDDLAGISPNGLCSPEAAFVDELRAKERAAAEAPDSSMLARAVAATSNPMIHDLLALGIKAATHCAFCGADESKAEVLLKGKEAYICGVCATNCERLTREAHVRKRLKGERLQTLEAENAELKRQLELVANTLRGLLPQ